ncbi:jg10816 [Pararge aegeria aegeria]|uniref:Jg10816 protein n=1 Tax=Pararge aegeria aegeria TaxID=348720 RepID=A0A8S4QR46_9NEOP|nr:jg10816 [Pararge aegeria aegeria]
MAPRTDTRSTTDQYFCSRRTYYNTSKDKFHKPGTLVKPSEALCNTLRIIAEKGGDVLYNGTLAVDFLEDLQRVGSIITAEDLRDYQ